ncbi:MAG TPA: sialate O-acetylesterase [Candidatus Mediterraneibacter norfolkensis]|nr:sialate O-acetylesterase [Candidatus Mediterraneibacter norfolkensis]
MAVFPPMEAKEGLTLSIRCGVDNIQITDISIGEVWIAAGQSNMEFYMRYDADCEKEKKECQNSSIRFFDVPEICYPGQEKEYDFSRMGVWRKCTVEDLDYFSAVAYYFAKKICRDLHVPVGIIGCNRGASTAAAWMSREALKEHGKVWLDEYGDVEEAGEEFQTFRKSPAADAGNPFGDPIQEELLYGISHEKQEEIIKSMPEEMKNLKPPFNNRPGCLYEMMLKQIIPCSVRGILWYQGESDVEHAKEYREIFRDLIRFWRTQWKEELPFCCVQLAPFEEWLGCEGEKFPIIRQAQKDVADEEKNVYLISTSDAGMRYDIHPKKKRPIGERLALCAQKHVYGMQLLADAPVISKAFVSGGNIIVEFAGDGEKLEILGDEIQDLKMLKKVSGEKWEPFCEEGKIYTEGKKLIIPINIEVANDRFRLEFAQSGYYKVNLYNEAGIPAMPFSISI